MPSQQKTRKTTPAINDTSIQRYQELSVFKGAQKAETVTHLHV